MIVRKVKTIENRIEVRSRGRGKETAGDKGEAGKTKKVYLCSMKQGKITEQMAGMRAIEKADYAVLLLMAIAMPIAWRIGMWMMVALCVTTAIQIVKDKQIGIGWRERRSRTGYVLLMLFFVIYVVAAIYSDNQEYGWRTAESELPFLLFPLTFVLGDKRYLTVQRARWLFYALWCSVAARFGVAAIVAVVRYVMGTPLGGLMEENFIDIHHSYIALYAVVAAGFGYSEIMRRVEKKGWKRKDWWLIGGIAAMVLTVVMVNSRAGIVYIGLLVLTAIVEMFLHQRRMRDTVIAVCAIAALGIGIYQIIPPQYRRITYAINEILAGRSGDCRQVMIRSGIEAAQGHWLFGYGSGDYEEPLQEQYLKNGFTEGYEKKMGSHNQYVETLLQCGAVGLVILVGMLAWPIVTAIRNKRGVRRLTVLACGAIAIEIFFESMLGRQMGILFVGYWYCIVIKMNGNQKAER